jgi:hypothetical protein
MKAKVTLFARLNDAGRKHPRVPVKTARQAIVFPVKDQHGSFFPRDKIMGFYARYLRDDKSRIDPLGKDPVAA